jgi:mono/diheme cytochrome c family protein
MTARFSGLSLCLLLVSGVLGSAGARCIAAPPRSLDVDPAAGQIRLLAQNWSDDEANRFYNVAQGSKLIPYDWFLHLEQPDSNEPFVSRDHIRQLGYLPRTPSEGNPDGLPVGFAKDGDHVGLTCAACHTAQINYRGQAWLIDGGPTLGDVEKLLRRMVGALEQTVQDPAKFDRLARAVLGPSAANAQRTALKAKVGDVLAFRRGYNDRNMPRAGAPPFGPGRVDALGSIVNEVTTTFAQVPGNDAPADAPVSYPCLWDTPQHDHVQWNGAAPNVDVLLLKPVVGTVHVGALGRNAGEVLGVFGTVDAADEGTLVELHGYTSSVNKENLVAIEESLRKLLSPLWPQEFGAIDQTRRERGQALFETNCRHCHPPIGRKDPDRVVEAKMRAVGTDQKTAANFATRSARTGLLEGRTFLLAGFRTFGPVEPAKDMLVHTVLRVIARPGPEANLLDLTPADLLAQLRPDLDFPIYGEIKLGDRTLRGGFSGLRIVEGKLQAVQSRQALVLTEAAKLFRQDLTAFDPIGRFVDPEGTVVRFDELPDLTSSFSPAGTKLEFGEGATLEFAYKGRPLNGVWATAPYLHNGSVPNLMELLKPASQRVAQFKVGSREYDVDNVGFRTDQGEFTFDATQPGNSNAGHEFGAEWDDDQRRDVIEYLKSL